MLAPTDCSRTLLVWLGSAGLDRPALSQLCLQRLGGQPEQVVFEAGYLSQVIDLRLTDGRDVVVKVRAWQGATAWSARVAASLRRLGVRQGARGRRRRAEKGWESLTASERSASELVAQGLTNRQAARRLHISPHTVNTHLRHVFQKLSVTTRAELAAMIARRAGNDKIMQSSDVSPGNGRTS